MIAPSDSAVVVASYGDRGFPWLDDLRRWNKEIHLSVDVRTGPREECWRNCDRTLREWWLEHRRETGAPVIWWLEWDVLALCPMPSFRGSGMVAANVMGPRARWMWYAESDRLPAGMRPVGAVPFGVTGYSRAALDAICQPRWDELYASDVFCELRTPSIISHCGLTVRRVNLPMTGCVPTLPGVSPAIYHPVKTR